MSAGSPETDLLCSPFAVNGKPALRNRVVLAPLYLTWDGRSEELRAFCMRRSEWGIWHSPA